MTLPAFATERASCRSISAARAAPSAANQPHAAAAAVDRRHSRPLHRRCCACNASSVRGNVAAMHGGSHELNKAQAIRSSPVSPSVSTFLTYTLLSPLPCIPLTRRTAPGLRLGRLWSTEAAPSGHVSAERGRQTHFSAIHTQRTICTSVQRSTHVAYTTRSYNITAA